MNEISLEKIAEKIHFGKSKEYFAEVLSSYHNKNYRSSVVMLWSVAVCDIIYKLEHLKDLYNDTTASQILADVTVQQQNEPKSAAWEVKLLDDAFNKTNLLSSAEHENLKYLQKQRHLCAHPILNLNKELETPNKDTVRSLIRNTLEGLLIKPPFYTQGVFDEMLADLSENTKALNTRLKVKQYIESRYLSRFTPNVELAIFRSLWKLVFKLDNEECEKNRLINLYAIEIISRRLISRLDSAVQGESDYYSNIASSGLALSYLVYFLSKYPNLYGHLSQDAKLKIQHCVSTDDIGRCAGWFTKESLDCHFNDLLEWIEGDDSCELLNDQDLYILEISDSEEWQESFCKLMSAYYGASGSYNAADVRCTKVILPHLHLFNLEALQDLLGKIEANSQTYGRGLASVEHPQIKERILQLDSNFDFSAYPRFDESAT